MHFHFDGEEYCEDCLPGPGEPDYGEQDYPAHCCRCHKPLDCTLTKDGVAYVIEALQQPLDWHYAIVRYWAQTLLNYSLSDSDRKIVTDFLEAIC